MRGQGYARRIARVPPFTSLAIREKTLETVRLLKRHRRLVYERFGSSRFSRPAIDRLDFKLEPYLPTRPGFFVEAGAHDGFTASNTYFLERFKGWSGVLIEPIPALYQRCVRERARSKVVNCALVPDGGPPEVSMVYRGPRSRMEGDGSSVAVAEPLDHLDWERPYRVSAPARTLSSVLDEVGAGRVDLMVIDVEGCELDALRGLDLSRHAPTLILVETNGALDELRALLAERYKLIAEPSPGDALFRLLD